MACFGRSKVQCITENVGRKLGYEPMICFPSMQLIDNSNSKRVIPLNCFVYFLYNLTKSISECNTKEKILNQIDEYLKSNISPQIKGTDYFEIHEDFLVCNFLFFCLLFSNKRAIECAKKGKTRKPYKERRQEKKTVADLEKKVKRLEELVSTMKEDMKRLEKNEPKASQTSTPVSKKRGYSEISNGRYSVDKKSGNGCRVVYKVYDGTDSQLHDDSIINQYDSDSDSASDSTFGSDSASKLDSNSISGSDDDSDSGSNSDSVSDSTSGLDSD